MILAAIVAILVSIITHYIIQDINKENQIYKDNETLKFKEEVAKHINAKYRRDNRQIKLEVTQILSNTRIAMYKTYPENKWVFFCCDLGIKLNV